MGGWAIALHGGAGDIPLTLPLERRLPREAALRQCLDVGVAALKDNKPPLDVVELVVRELENCPHFNAGRGSVLTTTGTVEMEACIMDGNTKGCGAVSGLSTVVNPISLARLVMEKTPHIYLGFDGAETFAREQGVKTVDASHFITPENVDRLKQAKEANRVQIDFTPPVTPGKVAENNGDSQIGTVGCVAVDHNGNLAAAKPRSLARSRSRSPLALQEISATASSMENLTENDMAGTENDIVGDDSDFTGADSLIVEASNDIDRADDTVDRADDTIDGITDPIDGGTEITEDQQGPTEGTGAKSSEKRWPGWPGDSVFRLLVPSHMVGGIIGRKGEFIKKICEESKARIKILEAPPGAPERAVMISAREEQELSISPAMDGLLRIHKRIIDGFDGEVRAPQKAGNVTTTRLLAVATQTGNLIGKHGATIKFIQEASNSVIRVSDDVPPFALPDDKVVEIQGEPDEMHKALELVASHLRKFLVDRSVIPSIETLMSRSISQMQQNMPPPQSWGHPQGHPSNHGGSGYSGNPQFMPPRPHDNFYHPPDMPPFEKTPHYGISTFGRDVPPMGVHPSSNQHGQPHGNQGMQHMQVPISFADAVIGAAGTNISYIRRASGATISIQETRGVPGEMTVEINGSATQIQTAKQLIQNFMAEAGAPPQSVAPPADYGYSSYAPSYGSAYAAPSVNSGPAPAPPGGGYGSSYGASYGY